MINENCTCVVGKKGIHFVMDSEVVITIPYNNKKVNKADRVYAAPYTSVDALGKTTPRAMFKFKKLRCKNFTAKPITKETATFPMLVALNHEVERVEMTGQIGSFFVFLSPDVSVDISFQNVSFQNSDDPYHKISGSSSYTFKWHSSEMLYHDRDWKQIEVQLVIDK